MLDSETRARLGEAIREHLATKGSKEWDLVRRRFPTVSTATFFRHVAKEKGRPAPKAGIDEARGKIAEALATSSAAERRDAASGVMPCLPSPAYIAKSGSEGLQHLDVLMRIDDMMTDLGRLRRYAMNEADEIVDPELFSDTIEIGIKLVGTAIKSIDCVYDQRRLVGFFDAIVNEVAAEAPEVAGRIIARLHLLDQERGYSLGKSGSELLTLAKGRAQ